MSLSPLSARLKSLRKSHGLTQQDIGAYLNISRQGYSHYENGTRIPDFHVLERLADLYGLTIDGLLVPCSNEEDSPGKIAEEEPSAEALAALSRPEQTLINLFSQLSPEDKDDFMDLLSIKLHQTRIRQSSCRPHKKARKKS